MLCFHSLLQVFQNKIMVYYITNSCIETSTKFIGTTSCFDGPRENTYLAMSSRSCRVFILWIIPIICYLSSPVLALFSPSTHSFSSKFMELQTISDFPYSFFRTQIFVFVLFIIGKFPLYVLQGIPQSAFLRSLSVQCRNMFNSC